MPPSNKIAALFRASGSRVVDITNYVFASIQKTFNNRETPIGKAPTHYYCCIHSSRCYIACHVRKCVGVMCLSMICPTSPDRWWVGIRVGFLSHDRIPMVGPSTYYKFTDFVFFCHVSAEASRWWIYLAPKLQRRAF